MSTRSSVWYHDDDGKTPHIHLYHELIEEPAPLTLEVYHGPLSFNMELPEGLQDAIYEVVKRRKGKE